MPPNVNPNIRNLNQTAREEYIKPALRDPAFVSRRRYDSEKEFNKSGSTCRFGNEKRTEAGLANALSDKRAWITHKNAF